MAINIITQKEDGEKQEKRGSLDEEVLMRVTIYRLEV